MKNLFLFLAALVVSPLLNAQIEITPIEIIHGPYLQNVSDTEATIAWITDKPSIGWVELAADGTESFYNEEHARLFDTTDGVKTTSTVHTVRLKGLTPGTRYRYRVFAQEVLAHQQHKIIYGGFASTNVYSKKPLVFRTSDADAAQVNFAVVNDIHGRNDLLEELVGQCDLKQTDFFIFNGDMVSVCDSEEQLFEGFMDTAVKLFAAEIPSYYNRGNHETRGAFAPSIHRYFSPREEHLYYTFRQGSVFFIVLDTGEDKPDSDIEYAGITDYDNYRTEQAEWLAKVVQSKEYREAPFKVVLAHMPPSLAGEDWHGNLEVKRKFLTPLQQAKPDLMLCAHMHAYTHHEPTAETAFPVVINANTSLIRVQASRSEMQVEVTKRDGSLMDSFTIRK